VCTAYRFASRLLATGAQQRLLRRAYGGAGHEFLRRSERRETSEPLLQRVQWAGWLLVGGQHVHLAPAVFECNTRPLTQ
jgi:hypothetical protein